jgi:hypothetical protein
MSNTSGLVGMVLSAPAITSDFHNQHHMTRRTVTNGTTLRTVNLVMAIVLNALIAMFLVIRTYVRSVIGPKIVPEDCT